MKKTIKTATLIILMGLFMGPIFQSCKKYPENPLIVMKSRSERVANTWKVDTVKKNGDDYTSFLQGYSETYIKNGAYSYQWGLANGSGVWEFQNKDKEIKLTGNDGHSSRTLFIEKLQENDFWYYYFDGNDKYVVHLITK
ncbi:MAG: hypothetical protein ACK4ND_12945 [Cytophagaceae bacterium]